MKTQQGLLLPRDWGDVKNTISWLSEQKVFELLKGWPCFRNNNNSQTCLSNISDSCNQRAASLVLLKPLTFKHPLPKTPLFGGVFGQFQTEQQTVNKLPKSSLCSIFSLVWKRKRGWCRRGNVEERRLVSSRAALGHYSALPFHSVTQFFGEFHDSSWLLHWNKMDSGL